MRATGGAEQSALARDAFSLLHFPMICGGIAYAGTVTVAVLERRAEGPVVDVPE